MKFYFFGVKNQEKEYASKAFLSEIKRFLTPLFEKNIYKYFDKKTIFVQSSGVPFLLSDKKTMMWDKVDMKLEPIGHLFTFSLSYIHEKGHPIQPYDLVEKGSLKFQLDNFPLEKDIQSIRDSWSEVIKDVTGNRLIEQKFRFNFEEKPGCMPPDVKLRIKTPIEGNILESLLDEARIKWNEQIEKTDDKHRYGWEGGLIHNLYLTRSTDQEKIITVDLGSTFQAGLLYLLKKLEESNLVIERVILE